jgi:arabinogalactan endo-1,4-beta-galactosidase
MKIRACFIFPYLTKIINDSYIIENKFRLTAEELIKKEWYIDLIKNSYYKYLDKLIKSSIKILEIEARFMKKKYLNEK